MSREKAKGNRENATQFRSYGYALGFFELRHPTSRI
jgi:hypothetical protein